MAALDVQGVTIFAMVKCALRRLVTPKMLGNMVYSAKKSTDQAKWNLQNYKSVCEGIKGKDSYLIKIVLSLINH